MLLLLLLIFHCLVENMENRFIKALSVVAANIEILKASQSRIETLLITTGIQQTDEDSLSFMKNLNYDIPFKSVIEFQSFDEKLATDKNCKTDFVRVNKNKFYISLLSLDFLMKEVTFKRVKIDPLQFIVKEFSTKV